MNLIKKFFPINSLCPSYDEQRSYSLATTRSAVAAAAFALAMLAAFIIIGDDRKFVHGVTPFI